MGALTYGKTNLLVGVDVKQGARQGKGQFIKSVGRDNANPTPGGPMVGSALQGGKLEQSGTAFVHVFGGSRSQKQLARGVSRGTGGGLELIYPRGGERGRITKKDGCSRRSIGGT